MNFGLTVGLVYLSLGIVALSFVTHIRSELLVFLGLAEIVIGAVLIGMSVPSGGEQ